MALFTRTPKHKAAPPPSALAAEQRRFDEAWHTDFRYEPLPQRVAAEQRLAELRQQQRQAGARGAELREAADAAQAELLRLETAQRLGEAKPAQVTAAREAYRAARLALDAYEPGTPGLRGEIAALGRRLDDLRVAELRANRERLVPAYRAAVAEMDAALAAAAAASDKLRALKHAGGEVARAWPGEWSELTPALVMFARGESKLENWRKQARAHGLLD